MKFATTEIGRKLNNIRLALLYADDDMRGADYATAMGYYYEGKAYVAYLEDAAHNTAEDAFGDLDEDQCGVYADYDCRYCGGQGYTIEGGDMVPYGSTWVPLPEEIVPCDCVWDNFIPAKVWALIQP